MEKDLDLKQIIAGVILGIWVMYSGFRVVKHSWFVVTGSWQPQKSLPFYLQNSPFYETYQRLKQP